MGPVDPVAQYFGEELRIDREARGWSRAEFGAKVGYAADTIRAFERGVRFPTRQLAEGADKHFGTGEKYQRMIGRLVRRSVYPESYRSMIDIEREATTFRWFESLLIPGLLQTEEYARALFTGGGVIDVEAQVAGRMARQEILVGDRPPAFVVLLYEAALHQPVGGRQVMAAQLRHLAEAADQAIIQVVPATSGAYLCLAGPFVIATVDGMEVVYTPTQLSGYVIEARTTVEEAKRRWDMIRAEALPRRQSRDLLLELARDER